MKRIACVALLFVVAVAWADLKASPYDAIGAHKVLHVIDTDIEGAFEIADADTGFTPLKANGVINVLYQANNTDTAYVQIQGIRADSTWIDTLILAPGRQVVTTAATFMALDQVWVQHETNGIVAVYSTVTSATSMLRQIDANEIHEPIAQIYAGRRGVILEAVQFTHLHGSDTTSWELRVYPDIADHRDFADGYEVRASARLNKTTTSSGRMPLNIYLPNHSWTAVFSIASSGSVAGTDGSTTLWYERR